MSERTDNTTERPEHAEAAAGFLSLHQRERPLLIANGRRDTARGARGRSAAATRLAAGEVDRGPIRGPAPDSPGGSGPRAFSWCAADRSL